MTLEEIKNKPLDARIAYWRTMLGCQDAEGLNKYIVKLAPVTTDVDILIKRKEKENAKALPDDK
jgi:hypothetical protein